ncbi:MAG: hypothetical protein QGG42_22040 [Phycisphaerae bacterium]|nr:hypothetical protein [Phycisphaerae bacterium]
MEKKIGQIPQEVLEYRNIFAHGDWDKDDKGQLVLRGVNKRTKQLPFTREKCKEIRLKFQKHANNVKEAKEYLTPS